MTLAAIFLGSALMLTEINIDTLVGPTHHFGGLGVGNIASQLHAYRTSRPREAALEGLRKAALIASLGVPQYLFLPPARPRLNWLKELGLGVDSSEQLSAALHTAPRAFSAAFSSAFMWAANMATVSAACDCRDRRLHITPANLISSWHRAGEAAERISDLNRLLGSLDNCTLHPPLSPIVPLRDEGAANHMRLCEATGKIGFNIFVYGDDSQLDFHDWKFLPRQTLDACQAIARRHQLDPQRTFFLQQHPAAISAGVFHNDVIAASLGSLLIHHELAFRDAERQLQRLDESFRQATGTPLLRIEIQSSDLPLDAAVRSYFFNSQIVTPRGPATSSHSPRMVLISPRQCSKIASTQRLIERLIASSENPIEEVHYVSLEQSMAGGGGPACLRLRVPLAQGEIERLPSQLRLGPRLEERLAAAIERWYPESLELADLCDPAYARELSQVSINLQKELQ